MHIATRAVTWSPLIILMVLCLLDLRNQEIIVFRPEMDEQDNNVSETVKPKLKLLPKIHWYSSSKEVGIGINDDVLYRQTLENNRYSIHNGKIESKEYKSKISVKSFFRGKEPCRKRLPHAIIIGIPMCGTLALLEFLGYHPNIAIAQKIEDGLVKSEPHFFDRNYENGIDWYLNEWMPCSHSHEVTIEKSPGYFHSSKAAARMKAMNESIKIILTVRDPVIRAVSNARPLLQNNGSFEDAVLDDAGDIATGVPYINKSIYWKFMENWLAVFPRDQILIVDTQLLTKEPYKELQRIENFLNLPSYFNRGKFVLNSERTFFCIRGKPGQEPHCLKKDKGRRHPDIQPEVVAKLQQFFKPHNERFFEITGKKIDWGY